MTLGEKIKELRMKAGWSQADLAKRADIKAPQTIDKMEKDKYKTPGWDKIHKIAVAFGINPQELLVLAGFSTESQTSQPNKDQVIKDLEEAHTYIHQALEKLRLM